MAWAMGRESGIEGRKTQGIISVTMELQLKCPYWFKKQDL